MKVILGEGSGDVVGRRTVLGNVESFRFLLFADANAHDELDQEEEDKGEDEGEGVDGHDPDDLRHDAGSAEDTDGHRAPDPAGSVDRDRRS